MSAIFKNTVGWRRNKNHPVKVNVFGMYVRELKKELYDAPGKECNLHEVASASAQLSPAVTWAPYQRVVLWRLPVLTLQKAKAAPWEDRISCLWAPCKLTMKFDAGARHGATGFMNTYPFCRLAARASNKYFLNYRLCSVITYSSLTWKSQYTYLWMEGCVHIFIHRSFLTKSHLLQSC